MADLTVLVPSRGRPHVVREMVETFAQTCTADTKLVFVLDDDDPELFLYKREAVAIWEEGRRFPLELHYHYPRRDGQGMVAALNAAARFECITAVGTGECRDERCPEPPHWAPSAIGFMGDDHRPRTPGWDARYLSSLRAGNLFVYGNDLLQEGKMPTQIAMRAAVVQRLGYIAPVGFQHLCIDLVWKDWGDGLGRIEYLEDVIVEHMHPACGKAQLDEGYERVNNSVVVENDSRWYYAWKETRLAGELEKLRGIA